jgi:hypothetical protein
MPPRTTPTERQKRLGAELRKMRVAAGVTTEYAAALLGLADPRELDSGSTFKEVGFDSVTAVELSNRSPSERSLSPMISRSSPACTASTPHTSRAGR